MVGADGLERVPVRDGVHQEKALPADHVLLAHSAARSAEKKSKLGRERRVRDNGIMKTSARQGHFANWSITSTHLNSSWPAVSKMSTRASSPSMTHCFRYESKLLCYVWVN